MAGAFRSRGRGVRNQGLAHAARRLHVHLRSLPALNMAIFELSSTSIRQIDRTTFAEEKVTERYDLQRLLRQSIEHISPDTMILDEEYGSFEGSLRRIDLLGLTRDAELVVIELKRTEGGGHLELQAIRYAAMISAMTFDDAVEAHRHYLAKNGQEDEDPRQNIVAFLGQGPDPLLSETVRIVLAAADFSPEVTTTVLWLNSSGLNSPWPLVSYGLNRCHAAPYRLNAIPYKSRT